SRRHPWSRSSRLHSTRLLLTVKSDRGRQAMRQPVPHLALRTSLPRRVSFRNGRLPKVTTARPRVGNGRPSVIELSPDPATPASSRRARTDGSSPSSTLDMLLIETIVHMPAYKT